MNVAHCMTRDVQICSPGDTIHDVARALKDIDAGSLLVGENDRLVGMITDRDITIRAVAEGKSTKTLVRDVMTRDVKYCFETDDIDEAASKMSAFKVRRLPVLNKDKRLVGVISLGDIWRTDEGDSEKALGEIVRPGGPHDR